MSEVQTVEERLAALEQKIDSFAAEHSEFRSVHVSRRGPEGGRGETGPVGPAGATGRAGRDGRDADISHVVEASLKRVREEFDAEYTVLSEVVRHELKTSGVIDENGKAILLQGPTRASGADSTVPGPKGDVGPAGRDGVDGKDGRDGERGLTGPQGERGEPGKDSVVLGPKGDRGEVGPEGIQGLPGEGLSRQDVIDLILDMKKRGTLK